MASRLALPLGVAELSVEGRESLMKNCRGFSLGMKMLGLVREELLALVSGSESVSTLLLGYLPKEGLIQFVLHMFDMYHVKIQHRRGA